MIPSKFDTDLDAFPNCTAEQNADARAYLEKHAPDLVEVVFGSEVA